LAWGVEKKSFLYCSDFTLFDSVLLAVGLERTPWLAMLGLGFDRSNSKNEIWVGYSNNNKILFIFTPYMVK
jgi:hypothetical protein